MLPGTTRNTATNGKGQQGRQKRSHVPFPRGGRHFGGDAIHDSNTIVHPPPEIKHSATGSQKYVEANQPTDTNLLSAHVPQKDKKRHLFPWQKKKSRTDLNTLSQGLSNTISVSTGHTTPYTATGDGRTFGNSSMPSLVGYPHKQFNEYDLRTQHPLDTQAVDDYFQPQTPMSHNFVPGTYDERRKPPILQSHRKAKEREKSDSSVLTTGSRYDDTYRSKESMDLDQDFGSMDEILNPEYRHLANGYNQPRAQTQDSAEQWAPPDSWGVQPAEGTNTPEGSSSIMDYESLDYDEYSMVEPRKYNGPKRNYCIRIFRPDGTFATLQVPLSTTAGEIVQRLASKFFMRNEIGQLCLKLKRRNLERVLQSWERPLQIQKTLLEQMGYTEQDNIADVGREDNSYLLRFVFGLDTAQTIPKEIEYGNKQHIDLQARNLPTVPVFLYDQASSIISLDLSKNLHMEIPVDFLRSCRQLKQLWLADNDYTAIPPSVHHVSGLEHLNISGNRLRDLQHARLEEIPGLKTMRAYNNRLEKLPKSFAIFKQMTMLSIANNNFTSFPEVICEMVALTHLDISFNKINAFPDEISNLKNLTRLFAIANRFAGSLPPSFAQLENLRELDIRQNSINDLDVLCRLPRLEILYVGYNAVSIVGCRFEALRQLKMTKNHLTQFNLGVCRRPSEEPATINTNVPSPMTVRPESSMLTELDLSSCMLSSLPDDVFTVMPNLEELILDSNTLNSIPSSIGCLRKLVRLSLQNNFLDSLPSEISKLSELKILDAQKNNLKMLPKEIWLCPSLQTLNCSSNLLETFPKPFSAPGVAFHLPGAGSDSAVESVGGSVVSDGMLPTTLGGHAGQGMVPVNNRPLSDGESPHGDRPTDDLTVASGNSGLQSPPNFNPPSFFASPRNHPPPLSLSLRRLFLGDNRLTNEIWSPLMLFLELRTLNLSFNDLDEIPPEHLCHQHLYELYLSGNHLTSLPADDIEKLSYLRVLAVNGNKLQTLPAEIGKLRKLLVLDVGNNVLKYNISNWPYDWNWNWNLGLKFLNLSGNKRLEIKKTHPEAHAPGEKDLADFSALTRLRMLGLMDVTILGVSIPEESPDRRVRTSPSEVNNMGYGVADWLGANEHLATWDLVMPRFRNKDDECIFGLFDGCKSTRFCSKLTKYLNDHLTYHVMNELRKNKQDDTVVSALRRAFLSLEKGLGISVGEDIDTGASAVVCYIAGTKLYVANVGDAMAVISRNNGQAFEITNKHIAINPSEISRIRAAGGFVSNSGKVNDELVVSRGFGYFDLVPIVNANPYIASMDLTENDEFVIMASRGLWERMNYQTAVDIARTEKDDFMAAAQKLRDFAITYGAEKDLMVMVIGVGDLFDKRDKRFRWRPGRATATADAGILLDDVSLGTSGMLMGKNKRRVKEEAPGDSTLARLDREVPPPINQVVLVFTDIKSSTMLWETQPENMRSAIKIHDAVMRRTLRNVGGYEVKTEGDAFMVCFQNIVSALLWCFTVQLQLLEADWPAGILATEEGREIEKDGAVIYRGLSVRMGVHYGTPVFERNPITKRMDYFGPVVNKASRICNAADGGQICVSSDVIAALRNIPGMLDDNNAAAPDELTASASTYLLSRDIQQLKSLGFQVVELGMRKLKGLETPEMLSLVFPKKLAGRMEMEERLLDEQASGVMKSTPDSPRLTTADTSLATSPRMGPDMSLEPSRVPTPTEDIEIFETPANEKQDAFDVQDIPAVPQITKPAQHTIDPSLVNSLCNLAIRLERLTTGHTMAGSSAQQEVRLSPRQGYTATLFADSSSSEYSSIGRMMEHHIMHKASDEELMILMENFVTRIENAASSFYLNKVGRFANVLEKLGEAIEVDPMHILRALQMYSEVAGLTDMPAGLAANPQRP